MEPKYSISLNRGPEKTCKKDTEITDPRIHVNHRYSILSCMKTSALESRVVVYIYAIFQGETGTRPWCSLQNRRAVVLQELVQGETGTRPGVPEILPN